MKDEQPIQLHQPHGARKFSNSSSMAQWETHQTDNSAFVLKKRTLIAISKGSEPYATPLNFPPPPGGSKQIARTMRILPAASARDKNEQSQRNYQLLRDPNLWIHRSMSDQINIMKELNSDLAECKFRDEEIRTNQEKLNFKLDHRRLQVRMSSDTKIPLAAQHNQQRAVTEINESLSKENAKESEITNNHEIVRQKHNYLAALDSLTPPKKHITSIHNHQSQQQPVNPVVPSILPSTLLEQQQSKLSASRSPSSTEDTHLTSADNHPESERVTIIRARGNCNHSRANHSNPNSTSDICAYSKIKLKSNKLYLQRLYSQIGPALQSNLPSQQLTNLNNPDSPYSKHAHSLAAIAICNHNKNYNNFQIQQFSQFQQSYQYPIQQQISQSNSLSSFCSSSSQKFFIETFHITPKAKEITQRKQRLQMNKQKSFQQSSSSSWEKEDQQNLSKDSILETQHPPVYGNINNISDRNSFSEIIDEGTQQNTHRAQQQKPTQPQIQATKKAERQQSHAVKKHHKKHPAEIVALGGSYALLFSSQSVNKLQKDKQAYCRFAAYRDFLQSINFSNRIYVNLPEDKPVTNHPLYRAYIGKGNNNMLIRMVIKQRWWWSITDNKDDQAINFVWTQQRKNDVLKSIKSLFKSQRMMTMQAQTSNTSSSQAQHSPRPFSNNSNSTFYSMQQQQSNVLSCSSLNSILSGQSGESTSDESCASLSQKQPSQQGQLLQQQNSSSLILQKNSVQLRKLCSQQDFNVLHSVLVSRGDKDIDVQAIQWNNNASKIQQSSQFPCELLRRVSDPQNNRLHNHLQDNFHLSNKKALFYNMREYYQQQRKDPFQFIPLTFHIQHGNTDKEYIKFLDKYKDLQEAKECNVWILKPGENTNRGSGIKVLNELHEIEQIISSPDVHKSTGIQMTYILQKYIHNPLLYYKRKFDIRTYYLLTTSNGYLKGYWYQDGYIRTASKEFTIKNLGKMIHLTNDAVQKKDDQYGKYEKGNKVSYEEMDKYIAALYPDKGFYTSILPQMKELSLGSMKAVYGKIDPEKKESSFEVFGLDFMIDENLKVFLIEVNTNPAIDICCPLLAKIIPQMIENSFKIAVDPWFPPPAQLASHKGFNMDGMLEANKYELIFDEADESQQIQMIGKDMNLDWQMIKEEEQEENEEDIVPE